MKKLMKKLCCKVIIGIIVLLFAIPVFAEENRLFGGLWNKGYIQSVFDKVYIGGYMSHEVEIDDVRSGGYSTFDLHYYSLQVFTRITNGISVGSALNFEHGGLFAGTKKSGNVNLEFAVAEIKLISDVWKLKGGIILVPFGKYNILHDSPLRDLQDPPLMMSTLVPVIWSDAGFGFTGEIKTLQDSGLIYDLCFINGLADNFDVGSNGTTVKVVKDEYGNEIKVIDTVKKDGSHLINDENGLRNARYSWEHDINNDKSFVGRIGYLPISNFELGVSGYYGKYDITDHAVLMMLGFDITYELGQLELLGEIATAKLGSSVLLDSNGNEVGVPPAMNGFYVQVNYHFLYNSFRDGDKFTGTIQYSKIDNDTSRETINDKHRISLGLNYRPVEDFRIGIEYQLNGNVTSSVYDRTIFVSLATYF